VKVKERKKEKVNIKRKKFSITRKRKKKNEKHTPSCLYVITAYRYIQLQYIHR